MICEIINPSDACMMTGDDREALAIAIVLLGNGQLGLRQLDAKDGETPFEVPPFLFGGHDKWWLKTFGHDFETGAKAYRDDIMKELKIVLALHSVVYGTLADLAAYDDAMELITQPDRRLEFQRRWNDKRRGSSNDIGGRARALAEAFEADHKKAGDPT